MVRDTLTGLVTGLVVTLILYYMGVECNWLELPDGGFTRWVAGVRDALP